MEDGEGFKINYDLLRGLPETKSSWPIYLGDYYTKGSLNINQVVRLLMEKFAEDLSDGKDIVATYKEYEGIWKQFAQGVEFGDEMYFLSQLHQAVPELEHVIKEAAEE
jgi:hypothetical protein